MDLFLWDFGYFGYQLNGTGIGNGDDLFGMAYGIPGSDGMQIVACPTVRLSFHGGLRDSDIAEPSRMIVLADAPRFGQYDENDSLRLVQFSRSHFY